jgi:phosphopantothenoylcysteine decarboxylase/phosphopantothenate--cysteine ligase
VLSVTSAEEMRAVVLNEIKEATSFIAAAAVADYKPKQKSQTKIKKSERTMSLELERTPDILAAVTQSRSAGQLLIGFAAETNDLLSNARKKMAAKDLDILVANDVSREGIGFDSEDNAVMLLVRDNPNPIELPLMKKSEVADRILDEVVRLRRRTLVAQTA